MLSGVLALLILIGQPAAAQKVNGAVAESLLTEMKSPKDLPSVAEVGPEDATIIRFGDEDEMITIGSIPAGTKVYILSRNENYSSVLSSDGLYGDLVENAQLIDAKEATDQDWSRITNAIKNPSEQASLDAEQKKLLQATFAAWFASQKSDPNGYDADSAKAVQDEMGKLALVRSRHLTLALPILLSQWEDRYRARGFDEQFFGKLAPKIRDQLGSLGDVDRVLCKRLREDNSTGMERYSFGDSTDNANIFFLTLIGQMHRDIAPIDCVVSAIKKIAATNPVDYRDGQAARPRDVPMALDLLQKILSKSQLEKWVAEVSKSPMPRFGGNLALALYTFDQVNASPYVSQLKSLANTGDNGMIDSDYAAIRMSLYALGKRMSTATSNQIYLDLIATPARNESLRIDALKLFALQNDPTLTLKTLVTKVLDPALKDGQIRFRQTAAEIIARLPLHAQKMTALRTLLDDSDPYISGIALVAIRNETLQMMKAAPSVESRAQIRGQYLDLIRKKVDTQSQTHVAMEIKKSPLWMIKPQARVSIQLRNVQDPLSNLLPKVQINHPLLELSKPDLSTGITKPDITPRIERKFPILPGQALLKYEDNGGNSGKRSVTITIGLGELVIDGEDIVDRTLPGLYTVELTGGDGAETARAVWYCEPNAAFWSEAPFERNE
jgi:hypothetical protein